MSLSYPAILALSFVDDLGFIASGYSVKELAKTLGQVATVVLDWGKSNAVTYDLAKTEAVLFSKSHRQRLNKEIAAVQIKIGPEKIKFNNEATRWLGIWLDSQLKFTAHVNEKFQRACTAEIQIKGLTRTYGLAPALIRRIQIVVVQSIALYGAELWWKRQKNNEHTLQKLVNRQGRAITGIYPSAPICPLLSEAGLIPAQLLLDARQKSYAYRLFTLPDCHPTKQILPISLKEGDENSQPGEQPGQQPEDTLIWAGSTKPKMFGQLLAQQVASNYSIYPAVGVEPVPNPGLDINFSGDIIIEAKKKALEEVKKYRAGNVFWVDGSKLSQGNAGAAACWKDKNHNRWENKSVFLGKNKEIIDAKLWAIAIGLETVGKITLDSHQTPIRIFSDSTKALNTLCRSNPYTRTPYLRDLIFQKTLDLKSKGHSVTIRWIPSHAELVGHDKADQFARNKAQRGGKPVKQWSLLTYIKKQLTESYSQKLTKWHEIKTQEREMSRRGFYIRRREKGMSKVLGRTAKKYASRYLQLKVGHGAVGTYLASIGVTETSQCWWCGQAEQSVEHLYTKCRKWKRERRTLLRNLYKEGIRWQGWTEKKGLAELFANEKAVGLLVDFLKSTEVGAREGAKERELELERRDDQAGEELLID